MSIAEEHYAIAAEHGISRAQLRDRIKGGMPMDRATTQPIGSRGRSPKVEVGSELAQLAESNGISIVTLRDRIAAGRDPHEAAMTPPQRSGTRKPYPLPDGRDAGDIAKANGIERATFTQRVAEGWDLLEAATLPLGQRRTIFLTPPRLRTTVRDAVPLPRRTKAHKQFVSEAAADLRPCIHARRGKVERPHYDLDHRRVTCEDCLVACVDANCRCVGRCAWCRSRVDEATVLVVLDGSDEVAGQACKACVEAAGFQMAEAES